MVYDARGRKVKVGSEGQRAGRNLPSAFFLIVDLPTTTGDGML